jgi:uncharacterized protein
MIKKVDYIKIIQKYIPPSSKTYPLYLIHVTLVTNKALKIANRIGLTEEQQQFIEEAGMLHDIGICKVKDEDLYCSGVLPYLNHGIEGRAILENEGLPKHALVCERHNGAGIYKDEIEEHLLPIPPKDYLAISLEEKLISYADTFFTKCPEYLWNEKSYEKAFKSVARFGDRHAKTFEEWHEMFEPSK